MLERQAEVLDLIQLETGKARLHAHEEVQAVAVAARHYGRKAAAYLRPKRHTGAIPVLTKVTELRHPRGVVGQIAPWNYPLELSVGDALPAFVAGNAVVMKPDTETALTALWARDLLIEAGLPAGRLADRHRRGPGRRPRGRRARGDYVSFTGSTRTGREVAQGAAARLVGCSLELGGKNAMLVLHDADMEKAAAGAVRGCFSSAGQLCISIERLYVHESVADAFVERFAARTKAHAARLGPRLRRRHGLARLASASWRPSPGMWRRPSPRARRCSRAAGARPDIGPLFYEPTILDGVESPMAVCTEETFGPVVSVYRFSDEDEAVELANATPYGLNSSVWTRQRTQRHARSRRGCAPAPSTSTRATPPRTAACSPRWAAWATPASAGGTAPRASSSTPRPQTVAHQRLLPMAPSFGMDDEKYAAFMSAASRP